MDLKHHLSESDPVAREPGLDAFHVDAMRQRVLREARDAEREGVGDAERKGFSRAWWLRPSAVATALAVCLATAVAIGLRMNERQPLAPAPAAQETTRQLQFATPGGTRIIWTFHQELDL